MPLSKNPVTPRASSRVASPSVSTVARRSPSARGVGEASAHKGRQTLGAILDAALSLASRSGLEGLSIGTLADITRMSKSGVFAHFGSREELQISVIREYHRRFEVEVFFPAMQAARGVPRLTALFDHWVRRVSVEVDSGCIYISGAVEFDDRPGPVRDALVQMVHAWHAALKRAIAQAIEEGQLRDDTDAMQLLFEMHGLILSLHHDARFLRSSGALDHARRGFARLIDAHRRDTPPTARRKSPRPAAGVPASSSPKRASTLESRRAAGATGRR